MNSTTSPAPAPRYVPLSRSAHATKRWNRYADYGFASSITLLPLIGMEIGHAAADFPVVFVPLEGNHVPMALLGLSGRNLFIGPQGQWLAEYVPAALRGHPFALGRNPAGQSVLCVDESSPLVSDSAGTPFFDGAGELAPDTRTAGEFLSRVQQGRTATETACKVLERHGCFAPLAVAVRVGSTERRLDGLFQVSEPVLNNLPAEALVELRACGALGISYSHLVSLHRLAALGKREAAPPPKPAEPPVDLSLIGKDGTFGFDAFR